ncbi:MAG: dolichyl-phosphate beta-glucosyltransferase [Candidatus Dormibacteraceae bacterium]
MTPPVQLSVVIPAYNEEERLPGTLAAIHPYLSSRGGSFEVVLADDGSGDGTPAVMRAAAGEHPYIHVVTLPRNRGKGRAIAAGVALTTGERVLISDADLSTPIEELAKLETALELGAGIAIASRALPGSEIEVHQPGHRVMMGKSFNLVVRALLLPGIKDTQCGFKLFRGEDARRLFGQLRTEGFAYDVEVLWRARREGRTIVEVPVRWLHSTPTRVVAGRHALDMLKDVLKLRIGL